MEIGAHPGVACFVMLTGYFQIKTTFKARSLLKLLLEVWFYSLSILVLFFVFDRSAVTYSNALSALFPLLSGTSWFVLVYVAIYLLSPFLNKMVLALSRDAYRALLAMLFCALCAIESLFGTPWIAYPVTWLLFCYLFAAYLRLYAPGVSKKTCLAAMLIAVCALLLPAMLSEYVPSGLFEASGRAFLLQIACLVAGLAIVGYSLVGFLRRTIRVRALFFSFALLSILSTCMLGFRNGTLQGHGTALMEMWMLPDAVLSIATFVFFTQLRMPHCAAVNSVALSVFGVYLIHDNPFMRSRLWEVFSFAPSLGEIGFLLTGLLGAGMIFAVCVLVDAARILFVERPLMALSHRVRISSLIDHADDLMNR